jgi:hypothetical protein
MTDLFRFISLRPPRVPPPGFTIQIAPSQGLLKQLDIIPGHPITVSQLAARARGLLVRGTGLIKPPAQLTYGDQYNAFVAALDALPPNQTAAAIAQLVNQIFKQDPPALVAGHKFTSDKSATIDTLIVAKFASDGRQLDIGGLNTALRTISIIESVAAGAGNPVTRPLFVVSGLPLQPAASPAANPPNAPQVNFGPAGTPGSDDDPGTGSLPPLPSGPGGLVTPIGIADLLVVKERLKRYEGGDIAHIENVLRSESFQRDTRRLDHVQTTVTTETDVTTEEERDNQSTDRFALQRESANTVKQDSSLKAGVAVTASYGPMVTVKANVDAASNTSQEDSTKQATSYSKDVTSRVASTITQATKQIQTTLTSSDYEESLHHGFDNKAGASNISGVYQWVNKVYEAQVYNYGRRLMFDVMVPEPAAFLISQMRARTNDALPPKPPPFTTLPQQIDVNNYQSLALTYGTTNLDPLPDRTITVATELEGTGMAANTSTEKKAELAVPAGYLAQQATFSSSNASFWPPFGNAIPSIFVTIGTSVHNMIGPDSAGGTGAPLTVQLSMENSVPVTIVTYGVQSFTVSVELTCALTERAKDAWKEKIHAAIMLDFQRLLTDYQKAVNDAANSQPGVAIQGQNPLLNRILEQKELKKACITLMTGQQYDAFGAIELYDQAHHYPQLLLANAEVQGKYVRFLEEAFEWEQMMYFLYPYYWGRKGRWPLHVIATDPDPLFSDFMNAGFARVVFPVRPGFDEAVTHLLETGEVWNGGDLPNCTDPLYVSIITELQEQEGAPGDEIAQGEPWEVTLPTTLVKLRPDDKLPAWGWDDSKTPPEWVEVS